MIADTVAYLRAHGLRVFLDAEHFFDGYQANPDSRLRVVRAADEAGAEALVLCDTNGGILPADVGAVVAELARPTSAPDRGPRPRRHRLRGRQHPGRRAAGATHVQGCINGYGERTGNADLSAAIPNLALKMGIRTIPAGRLERLTPVVPPHRRARQHRPQSPAALRGSVRVRPQGGTAHQRDRPATRRLRAHLPDTVGNGTRFVVSELAGRPRSRSRPRSSGSSSTRVLGRVVDTLKALEHAGYHFEVADGSLELLLRAGRRGWEPRFFTLESFRVITDSAADGDPRRHRPTVTTEATVKVHIGGDADRRHRRGQRPGERPRRGAAPGHRAAYPALAGVHLTDYRVRVLDTGRGTGAVTRVLVDTERRRGDWSTIGVSENIIEASLAGAVRLDRLHPRAR